MRVGLVLLLGLAALLTTSSSLPALGARAVLPPADCFAGCRVVSMDNEFNGYYQVRVERCDPFGCETEQAFLVPVPTPVPELGREVCSDHLLGSACVQV